MGEGGYLTLVNGGNADWVRTFSSSYQMDAWSWPDTIPAGQAIPVYVEWNTNIFKNKKDDAGEATYTIAGTNQRFQIQARAKTGSFNLQVFLESLSTQNNGQGSTISLGWDHDGYVPWILSGSAGNFYSSSNPPSDWMHDNLAVLGGRTLRQISIPGSHDAGMSVLGTKTGFSTPENTLTQRLNIAGQLNAGSRYFDIRPVISGGIYKTGHYSYIEALKTWQGGNGQTMSEVIDQVNAFTNGAGMGELVILNLSHDYNTDVGNESYRGFNQGEWDGLFAQLKGLNNLFVAPNPTSVDLTSQTLNSFVGNGRAAVLVIVEPGWVNLGNYHTQGFYKYGQFDVFNSYTGTPDGENMANDQLAKLSAQRPSRYFLLSWTLTQDAGQVIAGPSILGLAEDRANPLLYRKLLASSNRDKLPNILYVDSFKSDITALALAINSRYGS